VDPLRVSRGLYPRAFGGILALAGHGPGEPGTGPGLLRMGLAPYSTRAELERVVDLIRAL